MTRRIPGRNNDALSPDFLDFITCLYEQRADVVLVGGYALGVHGVVRATGDIDGRAPIAWEDIPKEAISVI